MAHDLYPLLFEPIYKEKVWGGRTLEKIGRVLPAAKDAAKNASEGGGAGGGAGASPAAHEKEPPRIGESWEIADLYSSEHGGGGGHETSIIANGRLQGRSLHEVIAQYGEQLLGRLQLSEAGGFPLLVKYLDARENLSVQVHPSPEYAAQHKHAHLKSEAWYIVAAEPGAAIYKGIQPGVTPEQFRAAIETNDVARVEPLMIKVPVKAGDCHYLPSGTCHALGGGILVAEVQTASDTTFRVFDWGRHAAHGRKLHIDEALACIEFGPPDVRRYERRSHQAGVFTTVSRLVTCEHFRIEKVRMSESFEQEIPYDQPAVWMVLEGRGRINPGNGQPVVSFARGQTLLLPANLDGAKVMLDADTVWLEVTFPKAQAEPIS